jgi:hypothetical protein
VGRIMKVDIKINGKIKLPEYKNCYMIEIQYMYGDADEYAYDKIGSFDASNKEEIEELKDALITCKNMLEAYPHGRGGCDDYNDDVAPGFNKWFNPEDYEEETGKEKLFAIEMEYDRMCDGHASFNDYNLVYYDEIGTKHNCSVKFSED